MDKARFFAVRTTLGQELNVALLMEERAKSGNFKAYSISVLPGLRGLVIVEADTPHVAQRLSYGIKHSRGLVRGGMKIEDLERFVAPKPVIETIKLNDIVEITGGPFVGMRGRVVHIDKSRGEIKVEISEAAFPLPITINAEYVKVVETGERRGEGG